MIKWLKIILITITITLLFTIVSVLCVLGYLYYLNSTNNINDIAMRFMNRYTYGEMTFENLHLDFEEFPLVRATVDNGMLISNHYDYPNDTIARFKHLDVRMDLNRLLDDSLTVYIPHAIVEAGRAVSIIDKNGTPSWNIWTFKKPKPKVD